MQGGMTMKKVYNMYVLCEQKEVEKLEKICVRYGAYASFLQNQKGKLLYEVIAFDEKEAKYIEEAIT